MDASNEGNPQKQHIKGIFKEYTTPSRLLRSFTNLSNTVIQTALSGQNKFLFEILQNADDAFVDPLKPIEVKFILENNYFIVHHNGKGFDFNDVERICDYASQIEEVKANDLSKTGYKGLGFKSLFNLSECIYIISNGYSFRFDKSYWSDPENRPWQVIPIWCEYWELPLSGKYSYIHPVSFIMKITDIKYLENQFEELSAKPSQLLFLHRINILILFFKQEITTLSKVKESFGIFNKVYIERNQAIVSSWLTRTYEQFVPSHVKKMIQGGSRFIYPDKIKKAAKISITYAIHCEDSFNKITKIQGLCYFTLPSQLYLSLPYHINSNFILNLDRTQLHENEWNEFLIKSVGYLQLNLLKDLAGIKFLKSYVLVLMTRCIYHLFANFNNAFLEGFNAAKSEFSFLPSYEGSRLLKLGEAWTDDINFFAQGFKNIYDAQICPFLIDYGVKNQSMLPENEAKHFTFDYLFDSFNYKYYQQLNKTSYLDFISYLYKRVLPNSHVGNRLRRLQFLITKSGTLLSPNDSVLVDDNLYVPDFLVLNHINNEYLPSIDSVNIKYWLTSLGAKWLTSAVQILQATVFNWIRIGSLYSYTYISHHYQIFSYIAKYFNQLSKQEIDLLKSHLLVLTENKQFKLANLCYVSDATTINELADVITNEDRISSSYDMNTLKEFFIQIGVKNISPLAVFRKSIIKWLKEGTIKNKLTLKNYTPIIKYFATHYYVIELYLEWHEKNDLQNLPVLTCANTFQRAGACFFKSAVPIIKGLECAINQNELVFTNNVAKVIIDFYEKIGVHKSITPRRVMQKTVLKWIQENEAFIKINHDNYYIITKYISEHYIDLNTDERERLKKLPLLTERNIFSYAADCLWPLDESISVEKIPGIKVVISSAELVSSHYYSKDKTKCGAKVVKLLNSLGVRNIEFAEIYDKYSDHLFIEENAKWFFSKLIEIWEANKFFANENKILNYLRQKFVSSPCLLAKNGKKCFSTELYSSKFHIICHVDVESVSILANEILLPEDLENWLGFKNKIDLPCMRKLFDVVQIKPYLGNEHFFRTALKEMKLKNKAEINQYKWNLLSEENKMIPAKDLFYFIEEKATCSLHSCYLKRINNMSHAETLELAELCGVNILHFQLQIKGKEKDGINDSLKKFYLDRLPYIVSQESKKMNKPPGDVLSGLFKKICSVKLQEYTEIYLHYPFGEPVKVPNYFDDLNLHISGMWTKHKLKVCDYLKEKLSITTNIKDIIDMDPTSTVQIQDFLSYLSEDQKHEFNSIVEELKNLKDHS